MRSPLMVGCRKIVMKSLLMVEWVLGHLECRYTGRIGERGKETFNKDE